MLLDETNTQLWPFMAMRILRTQRLSIFGGQERKNQRPLSYALLARARCKLQRACHVNHQLYDCWAPSLPERHNVTSYRSRMCNKALPHAYAAVAIKLSTQTQEIKKTHLTTEHICSNRFTLVIIIASDDLELLLMQSFVAML